VSLLASLGEDIDEETAGTMINDIDFQDTLDSKSVYDNKTLIDCFQRAQKSRVSTLNLSRKSIKSIPKEIGDVTCLVSLILSNNKISDLPSQIKYLNNLKVLDLGVNLLTSIPLAIYSLTNLTELHLEHNKIIAIEPEISNLENLQILNMFANQLTIIPNEVCRLSNLKKADFGINFIVDYPPQLLDMNIELILDDKPPSTTSLKPKKTSPP